MGIEELLMNTFQERQWIRKMLGYWIISAPLVVLGIFGLISLIDAKMEEQIKNPLIVFCSIPIILATICFFIQMKTDVNENEIVIRFFPLPIIKRKIGWNQISKVYVRKFEWGEFKATGSGAIPFGHQGTSYHLFGEYGLQIVTMDGDKILIGTRQPKSLQEFLKRLNKL